MWVFEHNVAAKAHAIPSKLVENPLKLELAQRKMHPMQLHVCLSLLDKSYLIVSIDHVFSECISKQASFKF